MVATSDFLLHSDRCELIGMLFASLQGVAGDSSFIASLAVSADYEKRFKTRLVTRSVPIPDHLQSHS